ncbi:hypothetical protein [Paenarthrobacter histidinolovorans]|uniref:Uncharacterized protein n=1 Tax=Paenarthrobacter histidinolovorans TaxID=43664 RepID=A0ABW8N7Y6_9MICC
MTVPNSSPVPGTPLSETDESQKSQLPGQGTPDSGPLAVQWPDHPEATGDALVDRALGLLEGVREAPVAEHGELYAGIHDSLLAALDAEPGLPAAPRPITPEGDS